MFIFAKTSLDNDNSFKTSQQICASNYTRTNVQLYGEFSLTVSRTSLQWQQQMWKILRRLTVQLWQQAPLRQVAYGLRRHVAASQHGSSNSHSYNNKWR